MRALILSVLQVCLVHDAASQGWGRTFAPGTSSTVLGTGIDAAPLADGGTLVFAQEREYLVKVDVGGNVIWERQLSGCGSIDALTEQVNGDVIGVCYVDIPGTLNGERYPAIVRLDEDGQLLWGIAYPLDSVWTYWPTEVINADLDEFYVLYTGMNTHRLAKFEANGTMLWTHDFTGLGFGSFGSHIPGGNLHLFNGPLEIVFAPDGTLLWEKYHDVGGWGYGFADALYDAGPFNHFFAMATMLQPGGAGNPFVPGIVLLDTLGNVINSRTWESLSSGSIWEQAMVISRTTTGFALACTDVDGHGFLLTCDSTLTMGSMTAHQLPFVNGTVTNGQHRSTGGMIFSGTDGDFFTGDRFVYDLFANGDVSACFAPVPFAANSLPPEVPIPNPWPIIFAAPALQPQGTTFATIPATLPSMPFCNTVGVAATIAEVASLHPNPGSGTIVFQREGLAFPLRASILDLGGRTARSWSSSSLPLRFESEGLAPGHYHVRVMDAEGRVVVMPFILE